jgi:O-antigen ligase
VSRLVTLVRRLVFAGASMAMIGILQFFTGASLILSVPGLRWNHAPVGVSSRSLFNRPSATALHPIEFSVVTAALFPLAIHFALYLPPGRQRKAAIAATCALGLAIPLSVSRSGIVSVVVGLAVLASGWDGKRRLRALAIAAVALPALWLSIPGLVGTLRSMFTGHATDDSIQGRIERLPRIIEYIRARPWLGRGEGTFNMEEYFVIDNGVYGKLIEAGVVGVAVLVMVIVVSVYLGLAVAHQPGSNDELSHLGRAVAAAILALAVSFFTFDAAAYRILMGSLFVLIGVAGALWRLTFIGDELAYERRLQPGVDVALSERS